MYASLNAARKATFSRNFDDEPAVKSFDVDGRAKLGIDKSSKNQYWPVDIQNAVEDKKDEPAINCSSGF